MFCEKQFDKLKNIRLEVKSCFINSGRLYPFYTSRKHHHVTIATLLLRIFLRSRRGLPLSNYNSNNLENRKNNLLRSIEVWSPLFAFKCICVVWGIYFWNDLDFIKLCWIIKTIGLSQGHQNKTCCYSSVILNLQSVSWI